MNIQSNNLRNIEDFQEQAKYYQFDLECFEQKIYNKIMLFDIFTVLS